MVITFLFTFLLLFLLHLLNHKENINTLIILQNAKQNMRFCNMEFTFEQLPKAVTQLCEDMAFVKRYLLENNNDFQAKVDELLTIQQAAEVLKLSVPTIYGLVSKAELPVNKRGKRLYFSKQELTEWIKAGRKKTQAEIQAEADAFLQSKRKRG